MIQDYLTSLENVDFKVDNDYYAVNNYTNLLDISKVLEKYKESIRTTRIDESERLERLSFRIYKSMQYWDTIFILNGLKSILELPTTYDKVLERAELRYQKWEKELSRGKSEEFKKAKKEEFLELENQRNEKFRYIKYIDPSVVSSFQLEVRNLKRELKRQ